MSWTHDFVRSSRDWLDCMGAARIGDPRSIGRIVCASVLVLLGCGAGSATRAPTHLQAPAGVDVATNRDAPQESAAALQPTVPAPVLGSEEPAGSVPCEQAAEPLPVTSRGRFEQERCIAKLERASVTGVLVAIAGAAPLRLNITDGAVDIAPSGEPEGLARVRSRGVLQFEGVAMLERYGIARITVVVPSLVRIGPGSVLTQVRAVGKHVLANVEIGTLELIEAQVPCSALGVTDALDSSLELVLGERSFGARDFPLLLRRGPSPKSPAVASLSGSIALQKLEERNGFARVKAEFAAGSKLEGWAEAQALEPLPSDYQSVAPMRGLGLCGEGCAPSDDAKHPPRAATLRASAPVHAAPHAERWASVTRAADALVAADVDGWFRVLELSGFEEDAGCHTLLHAYVPATFVALTQEH